jgi:hypothetical protein
MKMKFQVPLIFLFALSGIISTAQNNVRIENTADGFILKVDNQPMMIKGVNWDYVPIGTNFNYSLWTKSDEFIQRALDDEMRLLQNMNVNAIRVYNGMQPKWIQYIYENYGIYTMINDSFGRYGVTIDGGYIPNTEYGDTRVKELLLQTVRDLANTYKNTPGLLIYMLGNENNYGLFWGGAETEDTPIDDESSTAKKRARDMYALFNEATLEIKKIDSSVPVAMCNGDLLYLDLIAELCPDVDIYGTNMYRGVSFGDAFARVNSELRKPIMFAEFGADAFNARDMEEDQYSQAYYMIGNWREIYSNAAGMGMAGNSIGGFTFQFSDGWWKRGQTEDLSIHNTEASWSNGGYQRDLEPGENNMNEEWFGICAKGATDVNGHYKLYPRAAYYALREMHSWNIYGETNNLMTLGEKMEEVNLTDAVLRARGDKAALDAGSGGQKLGISLLRAEFTTYSTGGSNITTPEDAPPNNVTFPDELGFDHMQSYFIGVEANPTNNMRANVVTNILGNIAENPIDEIFYENRARQRRVQSDQGFVDFNDINRVQIYTADAEWNHKFFDVRAFYRTGHYHWEYEGDFFGLYPETNYGPNLDIYNGETLGAEIDAHGPLEGLKIAFGPQLWWGANPALLAKYRRSIKGYDITAVFHEDIDNAPPALSSIAIPQPRTRRGTLTVEKEFGKFGVSVGGIWGGQPLIDRSYPVAVGTPGNYTIFTDFIQASDTWGGKAKLTYTGGKFNAYMQGSAMGIATGGGADVTTTFTGWRLRDSGSGNQTNFLAGFTYGIGNLQIAPNFLWQKPLVDAIPRDPSLVGQLRNIQDHPFIVRANRETTAAEILLSWDPTPATFMYEWDNDRQEDAEFAANLGFWYRHHPTSMDANIIFDQDRNAGPAPYAVPIEDLWEIHSRVFSRLSPNLSLIGNFYYGNGQANGSGGPNDDAANRLIRRFGGDVRAIYDNYKFMGMVKVNDWGPFDYHRDFNLTFPVQFSLDFSTTLGKPDWFILPNTVAGIRYTIRTLDEFSNRYEFRDNPIGFDNGTEWEIRTYLHINIGK